MNRKHTLISLGLITALFLMGCHRQKEQPIKMPPLVTAFQVEPRTIPVKSSFVGVAKSSHPVDIRARVEGYLLSIDYTEGSRVQPGDPLFHLDPTPFEASLQEALGELARAQAELWRAERSLARLQPLLAKNAASQKDVDDATASVLEAEGMVLTAQGNVKQAEINLSYTRIISPIEGLTSRASSREGTLITPGANGLLTEVSVIDPIWVVFSISDQDRLQGLEERADQELVLPAQQDYTVQLRLADGTLFPHTGTVNFLAPVLDPDTSSLVLRATFPNPEGLILPGQFVQATLLGATRPNALFVPQAAVSRGEKGEYLYVIDRNNRISLRDVVVGEWFENFWIIKEGLQPGDIVVVEGTNKIAPGDAVTIQKIDTPPKDLGATP
ncbi:MAG: efflux RND transporter periplasmic adaptor subunit [Chlamydiae bacterium]|nr:efflux RND transporter periplasmic adaptor subunit [Chlamydiota bacterium]